MRFYLYLLLLFLLPLGAGAAPRTSYTINECWAFKKGAYPDAPFDNFNDKGWASVSLPHTWNAEDALDDTPGYYRGESWYRKKVMVPSQYTGKRTFIYFEGANQETEVYVNGKSVGVHIGGYTRFCFNITNYLRYGKENVFAIKVNNRHNEDIPPLAADYTFWGGIYRDVYLEFTDDLHFTKTDNASTGIYAATTVTKKLAEINIRALITNDGQISRTYKVETSIVDPKGLKIASNALVEKMAAKTGSTFSIPGFNIKNPMLWRPDAPNLYRVYSRIYNDKGVLLDEVVTTIGLRWFNFSANQGFSLNGKPLKLIGTNRHQDYLKMGNALRDEMHVRDIRLLKEMGGNFLRISHYPQDPMVLEMCDKLGILTSVEIPIVSTISESSAFHDNSMRMAMEMVKQDFNHPSVIIWGYMNEVLLHPRYKTDSAKLAAYYQSVKRLAQDLDDQTRKEDPSRYTMMACNGSFDDYHKVGLDKIPMILGWNLYQGWYSGTFSDFDKFIDNVHLQCPSKPLLISEYGVDVDTRLHSFNPQRFDFTVEYGSLYHEHYFKAITQRPFIAGATIWNLSDFYSEARKDAVPHVNSKGITELDRQPKDTYLFYQAKLNQAPTIKIGSRNWKTRSGLEDPKTSVCIQPVAIYSNLPELSIYHNGQFLKKQSVVDNIVKIDIPFTNGTNVIEAVGGDKNNVRDMLEVDFRMVPTNLSKFTELNVMLGSQRYFEDRESSTAWIPEKAYSPGSWGYIGGKCYERVTRRGTLSNSDKDISNEEKDPIYQTQRKGIESFKLNVPNGTYSIYCYWASLKTKNQETVIYNLGNDAASSNTEDDILDMAINNVPVLYNFNVEEETGENCSVVKKFNINVSDNNGITINFKAIKGTTVLNAIRVYRNY